MKFGRILFGLLFLFSTLQALKAQVRLIDAGPDVSICFPGSVTLNATLINTQNTNILGILASTSYLQSTTAYNPDSYTTGTSVFLSDDSQTGILPIGFPFCYFGVQYTNCIIGSNNWLGFVAGQTSTWVTVPIPSNTGNAPRGTIMGPWQDINPGVGGQIRYQVHGTPPFRRLKVAYNNVPMFSCTGLLYTSQIIIYETTNVIETHIANKPLCPGWNSGNAVHGLHSHTGTVADVVTGRNNTQWTTNNEGRRWTPNGVPTYTVSWYSLPSNTLIGTGLSITVTPSATSTYRAVITGGCGTGFAGSGIPDDTVVVSGAAVPPPPLNGTLLVCPNGSGTYTTASVPGATYNWIANNGTITSGQGTTSINVQWGTGSGKVYVQVGTGGCTAIDSLTVGIHPAPNIVISGLSPVYCLTSPSSLLTATPTGGSFSGIGISGALFDPSVALTGNHTITYTLVDVNGCVNFLDTFTTVNPTINSNLIGNDQTICQGTSPVQITGSVPGGGNSVYQYQWESSQDQINWFQITGSTLQNHTPTALSLTTYFRRIVTSGLCVDISLPVEIWVDPLISPDVIGADQSICIAQTPGALSGVTPTGGNGGYQYYWEESIDGLNWIAASGTNVTAGYSPGALNVNTYYRRTVSAGVCTPQTSPMVTITIFQIPVVQTSNVAICAGQSSVLSADGQPGGGTYLWSPGAYTTATITVAPMQTTTYSVVYTLNGCSSPAALSVLTVNPNPPALITPLGTTDLCPGASVTLQGPAGPATYLWSHNALLNNQLATVTSTGTYGLTITDPNGCISIAPPITVTVHTNPVVHLDSLPVSCFGGSDGQVIGTYTQGTPTFTYLWSPGAYTTSSLSGVPAGTYTVVVTDRYGCQGTSTITVIEPTLLQVAASQLTGVTCPGGNDGTATSQGSGGNGGYGYVWSTGAVGQTVSNLSGGNHTVTVTDSKGCVQSQTVTITEPAPLRLAFVPEDVRCFGESNGIIDVTCTGGTSPYIFEWNTLPAQIGPSANNLKKGTYQVKATDMNGCSVSGSSSVNQPDSLIARASVTQPQCFRIDNGSAQTQVTGGNGGYNYQWNTTSPQRTSTATGLAPGYYVVTVSDSKNCVDTAHARLVYPAPVPTPQVVNDTLCPGETAMLAVANIPGYQINWYNSPLEDQYFRQGSTMTVPGLTRYQVWYVEYQDENGCFSTRTPVFANVRQLPSVDFAGSPTVVQMPNATVTFNLTRPGSQIFSYTWDFGDGITGTGLYPVHQYTAPGTYPVRLLVVDSFGCRDTILKSNYVEVEQFMFVILPNAFSPNGDGVNDFLSLQYRMIQQMQFTLFDRWGNQVYTTTDMNFRWDGTLNGIPVPEGTYVYTVTGITTQGTPVQTGGTITVIR